MIELPLAASASDLWKSYLNALDLIVSQNVIKETPKTTKEKFKVALTINSIHESTSKFTMSKDWIIISDNNPDTSLSRKVCINFTPAFNTESYLTIEFINALDNDTNHAYNAIKKMKFLPGIFRDDQFYMLITSFLVRGTSNPSFYFTHSKFRKK